MHFSLATEPSPFLDILWKINPFCRQEMLKTLVKFKIKISFFLFFGYPNDLRKILCIFSPNIFLQLILPHRKWLILIVFNNYGIPFISS